MIKMKWTIFACVAMLVFAGTASAQLAAPELTAIGAQSVDEGATLNLAISATDTDGTTPSLTTSTLPTNASFLDNGNGTADFSFTPDFTQAGSFVVTFYANDEVTADVDSEQVTITVNDVNRAPVLNAQADTTVAENGTVEFTISATDPDGTTPTLSAEGVPTNATFTPATGLFSFSPDFDQAGSFPVDFIATDGTLADTITVTVTVTNVNRAPVLNAQADTTVAENGTVEFTISAIDPDGTTPTLSAENVPLNASFTPATGLFSFSPDFDQAGSFPVDFIATDGTLADTITVTVTVTNVNRAPVLDPQADTTVAENGTVEFTISATDPDGTTPTLSAENVPTNATFTPATGLFSFSPDFDQAGSFPVDFIATDGTVADTITVTVTVTNVNRAPALNAQADTTVAENGTVEFTISATDPDGTTPTLSAENVPTNATFTPATGLFSFSPDFDQAGSFPVDFIATDGTLADTITVTITVGNTNRAPVLNAQADTTVAENGTVEFTISATDPDGTTPTLSAENVPANATFTPATGLFSFSPDFDQAGSFPVDFIATDGDLADTITVTVTVTDVNRAPVLNAQADTTVAENGTVEFTISATDPDGTTPVLSAEGVPTNATFTPATGLFSFSPDFDQAGSFPVDFIATDGTLADTITVTVTVTDVNRAPVLNAQADTTVAENGTVEFTISATDPDGTTPTLSAENVPTNATFTPATGVFSFSPDFDQAGSFPVDFIATDGSLADTITVTITVGNTNRAPVLNAQADTTVAENGTVEFTISAIDPDGTTPTLSAEGVPTNATFTPATGLFSFSPDFDQAGSFPVDFIATDGDLADTITVTVTVTDVNRAPVLNAQADTTVAENGTVEFTISATDPDGTTPTLSAENVPTNATFTPATGLFSFSPDFDQAGSFPVDFIATDGTLADTITVTITVTDVNRAPVLNAQADTTVAENGTVEFTISATDPDGTTPTLSAENVPTNATFTPATGLFSFSPDFDQAGTFPVDFIATDGTLADTITVTVTVTNVNRAPALNAQADTTVAENGTVEFTISATDPDGTTPTLSAENFPTNATFTPATGLFSFSPDFDQAGSFPVDFIATDGTLADTITVTVTVTNVNRAPALNAQADTTVAENGTVEFTISATDPDGTTPTLSAENVPTNATFTPATGLFSFSPDFDQAGSFPVDFIATDGTLADTITVTITVGNTNRAPVLNAQADTTVAENGTVEFTISATDPDGTTPTLSAEGVPTNATFTPATGLFSFSPDFDQAGSFPVDFIATDGALADTITVTITVGNTNRAPVLNAQADTTVAENGTVEFTISATDPDGTTPVLSAEGVPTNATFTPATGLFSFSPDFDQAGSFPVDFIATDGDLADTITVTVTVTNVNRAPVLNAQADTTVAENGTVEFTISATDPDGTTPTLSAENVPTNATFTPATGLFSFSPDFTQAGSFPVDFIATDGDLADTITVTITVTDVNRAPVLNAQADTTVAENGTVEFTISATDPDGTTPTLSAENVPTNATFTPATGVFSFSPDFDQAGSFPVDFIATDGDLADTITVTITVGNTNRAPVLNAQADTTVAENGTVEFTISATDPDGTTPTLSAENVPTNAIFTPATGLFSFSPDFDQAGSYPVDFIATDGDLADTITVTITVGNTNRAPVLNAQADTTVAENGTVEFTISATDPDGTTPTLSAENVPTNATFTPATGLFSFSPDFDQAGSYPVDFIATDGTLADTITVTITVGNTNRAPVQAAIGARSIDEGQTLAFLVTATDPDGNFPGLSAAPLPTNASLIDNGDGTANFSFTPDFTQAGTFDITFTASDGDLTDDELVTITVNQVNLAPVLATIGAQSITEGATLDVPISASDPDGTIPVLTTSTLPANASFTDNGDGTADFSFSPTFVEAGVYNVTFYATDDSLVVDSELVVITVNEAGNQTPILATIGAQGITEGATLAFTVAATDPDETTPTLSTSSLPVNASFTDNGDGTGDFTFTPGFLQSGVYAVTFFADDGLATDSEVVSITVADAGNQSPVLAAIGARAVAEGGNLAFVVTASDPDGTTPSLSTSTPPANASFGDNGNGTGNFSFSPDFTQAGSYDITFYASDGVAIDSEIVTITVSESGNQAPVLAEIGPQTVTEGTNLAFTVSATDADGTTPTFSTSALPTNASFTDNGDGTGDFSFDPNFLQSGIVPVTFRATDGVASDSEIVFITIVDAGNQAPVLATIGAQSVTEGGSLAFGISATDPDNGVLTLTTSTLPTNASFVDNGDGTGDFTFDPDFIQAGDYDITFTVTDDSSATDFELVTITVNEAGNQVPVLAAIGAQSVNENELLTVNLSATDPDATFPAFTVDPALTNATLTDNGDGTAVYSFSPDFFQAGSYDLTFVASDGALADSEVVTVTVVNINRDPVLAAIGAQATLENQLLAFTVSASDLDLTFPTLTTSLLPANASFVDNGDGTGDFSFTPSFYQAGSFDITFYADDGEASDSELVTITVTNVNQEPILVPIGAQFVTEGQNLLLTITGTDADSTALTLTTSALPPNATFVDNGDNTATFDFTPDYTQSDIISLTFYVTDGVATDSELVFITINEAGNQAPEFAAQNDTSVTQGETLELVVSAIDPDATTPSLTAEGVPTNGAFVDNGDGTGTLTFSPDFTQAGAFPISFIATDGTLADTLALTVTVTDAGNQAPVFALTNDTSVTEGATLVLSVSASDPDATIPTLNAENIPVNGSFVDNTDGTGTLTFSPDFVQAGTYPVTFIATDGALADTLVVTITVDEAGNQTPVFAAVNDTTITETETLILTVSASDPDLTIPALSVLSLPTNAGFVDNTDGTGTLTFTPDFTQAGDYPLEFIATDGVDSATVIVTITVLDGGNQAPVFAAQNDTTIAEGATLLLTVSASDVDATIPSLTAENVPTNGSFVDNTDGTGTLTFTPDVLQAGAYAIDFIASDGALADTLTVTVTVTEVNQAPVADAGVDQVDVIVGTVVTLDGTGSSDIDLDALTYLWTQISGTSVALSDNTDSLPTFTPTAPGIYEFELVVSDGFLSSAPDTVSIAAINGDPPAAIADLAIAVVGETLQLDWSEITLDAGGLPTTIGRYVVYRGTSAYFTPTATDSIGFTDNLTFSFTDNDIGGVDVVGDTAVQYFYTVVAVDIYGNRSTESNRVGEYDYPVVVTASTDYNLIGIPFANTGITDAVSLINAIGSSNVNTVNRYIATSQSYESRFAAGFGVNFAVAVGGVYQVNAAANTVFTVAGSIPAPGSVSYSLTTTATTDFNYLMIPFERESDFAVAQDVIDNVPGILNTLNNFIAASQSFESRFALGFGVNFPVKAGKPYQANVATNGAFPGL